MEQHDQIRQTQKKYGSLAMTISIFTGLVLILAGLQPLGKGLILGSLFSVFNFIAIGISLPYRIGHSRKRATLISALSLFIRYILLAVPLILAIRMDQLNLAATICGLFMIQFLILIEQIIRLYFSANPKRADY